MGHLAKGVMRSPYLFVFIVLGFLIGAFFNNNSYVVIVRTTWLLLGVTLTTLIIAYIIGKWTSQ